MAVNQITAPLVPKVKGAGDTRHFQEYEENGSVFKIKAENVHAKEFEDFWGLSKKKKKIIRNLFVGLFYAVFSFECWFDCFY